MTLLVCGHSCPLTSLGKLLFCRNPARCRRSDCFASQAAPAFRNTQAWVASGRMEKQALSSAVRSLAVVMLLHLGMNAVAVDAQAAQLLSLKLPWDEAKSQVEPSTGSCATCIGVVDETLGSCTAVSNCVSSFDDRPMFFVAPWEFPGDLGSACTDLKAEVNKAGGDIKEEDKMNRYIHATFSDEDGVVDDVEFLFSDPASDATVCIRSASRAVDFEDYGRNRKRLESIRQALRWEEVPVLRNRLRRLFVIESPWDTFGPEPPPTFEYKDAWDFAPE